MYCYSTVVYRIMLEVRTYVQVSGVRFSLLWDTGYKISLSLSLLSSPYHHFIITLHHFKIDANASWLASKLPNILAR